jgi:hypothetical protein
MHIWAIPCSNMLLDMKFKILGSIIKMIMIIWVNIIISYAPEHINTSDGLHLNLVMCYQW